MIDVLVLDNRDSFVFNLVDDLARGGLESTVLRGDIDAAAFAARVDAAAPRLVLLSPGPGHPDEAVAMTSFLARRPRLAVLGVCLGMQAMVCALGGRVDRAARPCHGRAMPVRHDGDEVFDGIDTPFPAGRYHSLHAVDLPDELRCIARAADDEGTVMAVRHTDLPWYGFQFHPESILTPDGARLLTNIVRTLT